MKQIVVTVEAWTYSCDSCGHAWDCICEAWHSDDGHGREAVCWHLGGMVGMPPWVTPACPSCLNFRVKVVTSRVIPGTAVPDQRPMAEDQLVPVSGG